MSMKKIINKSNLVLDRSNSRSCRNDHIYCDFRDRISCNRSHESNACYLHGNSDHHSRLCSCRRRKVNAVVYDILIVLINVMLLVSFYWFISGRVSLAADVYFIPVNYPASEASALHISIVGAALYIVADIVMIVTAFVKKKNRLTISGKVSIRK